MKEFSIEEEFAETPVPAIPPQPKREDQWYWHSCGLDQAVQLADHKGEGMLIGIVDSGVNTTHPEFIDSSGRSGSRVREIDLTTKTSTESQSSAYKHGTAIASLICGYNIGVLPNANALAIRVRLSGRRDEDELDEQAEEEIRTMLTRAVEICASEGCHVVNLSLGISLYDSLFREAITRFYDKGKLFIAAVGNNYSGANFPAVFGNSVIGVGGMTETQKRYMKTNLWSGVDILAPAERIIVADSDFLNTSQPYRLIGGTSCATAVVTGTVGLAIGYLQKRGESIDPSRLQRQLYTSAAQPVVEEEHIRTTMESYGLRGELAGGETRMRKWMFGNGLLRADAFLEMVRGE